MHSSSCETVRNGDSEISPLGYVDIPPPYTSNYLLQDSAGRNIALGAEKRGHEKRPLPPATTNSASVRRRASGGFFLADLAPPAKEPKPKTVAFHVCNPGPFDSPTSPVQRERHSLRIIPPTPLPPPTPARTQSDTTNSPLPMMGYPTPDLDPPSPHTNHIRATKMHRRLGGSVGSIPASVLAELRSIGESGSPSLSFDEDAANSSRDEDDEHAEEKSSWSADISDVRRSTRISLKWVRDLGGDRWIADRYSDILRAV